VVVGAGFVGGAIAAALSVTDCQVTVVSRRPVPLPLGVRGAVGTLDRTLLASVIGPDTAVVYAAGPSVPSHVEADPSLLLDSMAGLELTLDVVRRNPGSRLFFISSGGTVYGSPTSLPVAEDAPLRPVSAYGRGKLTAERRVKEYALKHQVRAVSLRCSNAYGPGQHANRGQGLVAALLDAARGDGRIVVWGDGTAVRDYIFIEDIAHAVARLIGVGCDTLGDRYAINLGSGTGTSVLDLIHAVGDVTGRPIEYELAPSRSLDVPQITLDVGLLCSIIDFNPVPLADGLAKTWAATQRAAG